MSAPRCPRCDRPARTKREPIECLCHALRRAIVAEARVADLEAALALTTDFGAGGDLGWALHRGVLRWHAICGFPAFERAVPPALLDDLERQGADPARVAVLRRALCGGVE